MALASKVAAAVLQHLRQVDPGLSPATIENLRDALDQRLQQLDLRVRSPGVSSGATGTRASKTTSGVRYRIGSYDRR